MWDRLQAAMAGGQPQDAFMAAMQSTPMFMQQGPPSYQSPFNIPVGGMGGMALQMFGMPIAQQIMAGQGMTPMQFLPTQNAYDFERSHSYYTSQMQAASMGARHDTRAATDFFTNLGAQITGAPATVGQRQSAFQLAQAVAQGAPIAAQFLGEDMVDQMFGARGSAGLLAHNLMQTGRTMVDPVTGMHKWSGDTAGTMAGEIFGQLYGPEANIAEMHGLGAGQAGALLRQLHGRGLGTRGIGTYDDATRFQMIADQNFGEADFARMAESSERIQRIRAEGRDPTADDFATARGELAQANRAIQESVKEGEDLSKLAETPGADTLLRATDAQRIGERLKGLAGTVTAMRDIFGDMGRPNAPMQEIINGLEALTQGGLANMSPSRLEQTVRLTHALAKQTGLGMQAMVGLTSQAANMADQLGVDRSFAVFATQGAAAFGQAFGDVSGRPDWGGLSKEEATLKDQQLRMQAAASAAANQMGATVRLSELGSLKAGSEAEALAEALRTGQTEYTYNGQTKSTNVHQGEWLKIMEAGGVSSAVARSARGAQFSNQEYINQYQLQDIARARQGQDDVAPILAASLQSAGMVGMQEYGIAASLREGGVVNSRQGILDVNRSWATGMTRAMMRMPTEVLNDDQKRAEWLAKQVEEQMAHAIREQGKAAGLDEAQINRNIERALSGLGEADERGIRQGALQIGIAAWSDVDRTVRTHPGLAGYGDPVSLFQMFAPGTMAAQRAARGEAATTAAMQSAMGGIGRVGPLARFSDAVQEGGAGGWAKILARTAGGLPDEVTKSPLAEAMAEAMGEFHSAERYKGSDEEIARKLAMEAGADWDKLGEADKKSYTDMASDMRGRITVAGLAARGPELMGRVKGFAEGGAAARSWLAGEAKRAGLEPATLPGKQADQLRTYLDNQIRATQANPDLTDAQKKARIAALERRKANVDAMAESARSGGLAGSLREHGFDPDAQVSEEHVDATAALGDEVGKGDDDAEKALNLDMFLFGSRDRAGQLMMDPAALGMMGKGALAKVRGIEESDRRLRQLAEEAGVSIQDLYAGKDGTPTQQAEAQKLVNDMRTQWKALAESYGPKKSDAPDAMTAGERASAEREKAFREKYATKTGTPEERAAARKAQASILANSILEEVGADDDISDAAREKMVAEIEDGRGMAVFGAWNARRDLLAMATDEDGMVIVDGEKVAADALTAKQREKVIAGLDKTITEDDPRRARYERLKEKQSMFEGLAKESGVTAADRLQKSVAGLESTPVLTEDQLAKQRKMSLHGTLRIVDETGTLDGEAEVADVGSGAAVPGGGP